MQIKNERPSGHRRVIAVVAAVAMTAAIAATAEAEVLVGSGIAGIHLGDTKARVEHQLGKGTLCSTSGGESSCAYNRTLHGRVSFKNGRVVDLWTGSCAQRTSRGIHPGCGNRKGSSLQQIRRAYPGIKCEVMGSFATCTINSRYHGRGVTTSFLIKSSVFGVAEIEIGYA